MFSHPLYILPKGVAIRFRTYGIVKILGASITAEEKTKYYKRTNKIKKNEFFEEKLKIQEELKQIKQNGSSWLEPFREWVGNVLSCAKIARAKNTCSDLSIGAKTVGSNFFLTNRQLAVSYKKGFAELCAPTPAQSQLRDPSRKSHSAGVEGLEPSGPLLESDRLPINGHPFIYSCILPKNL